MLTIEKREFLQELCNAHPFCHGCPLLPYDELSCGTGKGSWAEMDDHAGRFCIPRDEVVFAYDRLVSKGLACDGTPDYECAPVMGLFE